jgi:ribonuclease HII
LTLPSDSIVPLLAGVDEAGRGPLVGPVVAAAVILDPGAPIDGINDSKKLSAETRERLAVEIRARAIAWSVAWSEPSEIDTLNILQATLLAMRRALLGLRVAPTHVQVDGNRCPRVDDFPFSFTMEAVVRGDAFVSAIGAASILAKTARDAMLVEMDATYPGYGFATHKGYPTPEHYAALQKLGPTPLHRMSFEPVRLAAAGYLELPARRSARASQEISSRDI